MKIQLKTRYSDCEAVVFLNKYVSKNRICLRLISPTQKETLHIATVNLPDVDLEPDEIAIKNYSENEGIYECLVEQEVIKKAHRLYINHFPTHKASFPIVRLTPKARKELLGEEEEGPPNPETGI